MGCPKARPACQNEHQGCPKARCCCEEEGHQQRGDCAYPCHWIRERGRIDQQTACGRPVRDISAERWVLRVCGAQVSVETDRYYEADGRRAMAADRQRSGGQNECECARDRVPSLCARRWPAEQDALRRWIRIDHGVHAL